MLPTEPIAGPIASVQLHLVGGFQLAVDGGAVPVANTEQRLLAFLALHRRPLTRTFVAGTLWSEVSERRAAANLRSSLWRLPAPGADLVVCTSTQVALHAAVAVDHHRTLDRARRLLNDDAAVDASDLPDGELLPGWGEEWVAGERERLRQIRLHAMEEVCRRQVRAGATGQAIDLGLAAVSADPLRESAQRVLVEAHLADGNSAEALSVYTRYRALLDQALGILPSPLMEALVAPLRPEAMSAR